MAVHKRHQSSAGLYALVTFIGLFIVAATIAVIYYVKAEDHKKIAVELQTNLEELASRQEIQQIGSLVGTKLPGQSRMGTMTNYLDQMVVQLLGQPIEQTSAEVKVRNAEAKSKQVLLEAKNQIPLESLDPNATGLVSLAQKLTKEIINLKQEKDALEQQLADLNQRFDDSIKTSSEKEQALATEKEQYHQQVLDITQKYDQLRQLMEQTADQRAQTLMVQLEQTQTELKNTNSELLKTQAELDMTSGRMRQALDKVDQIEPGPDREAAAYKPDGKILLVDEPSGIVHLDLGSDDKIYQGLTFSVYDKSAPIPKDGKPKAEIEVFGINKTTSIARIITSQKKNPIGTDDIIANLIWDTNRENTFVVAGDFDIDADGSIDRDAMEKIGRLIAKWGGTIESKVDVTTDYVILGETPDMPRRPTFEDLEEDPTAQERYDAAQARLEQYEQIETKAQGLWIPVLTYDRFLDFIGYKSLIDKPGAF